MSKYTFFNSIPLPFTSEGIAFVENFQQMKEDEEWAQVWQIMLDGCRITAEERAKFNTPQNQYQAYMQWLDNLEEIERKARIEWL